MLGKREEFNSCQISLFFRAQDMMQVQWITSESPMFIFRVHSRWFAKCGFVRLVKGDEFIARCLAERPTQDNSQQPQQAAPQQQQVRDIQGDHGGQRLHFVDFIFDVPQCCPTALQFLPNCHNRTGQTVEQPLTFTVPN